MVFFFFYLSGNSNSGNNLEIFKNKKRQLASRKEIINCNRVEVQSGLNVVPVPVPGVL